MSPVFEVFGEIPTKEKVNLQINVYSDFNYLFLYSVVEKPYPQTPSTTTVEVTPSQTTNDQLDWGVNDIDAEVVWGGKQNAVDILSDVDPSSGAGLTGEGVKVAIIDTGVDFDHPDIKDNIAYTYNCMASSIVEIGDVSDTDSFGHGTHIAGIIAAEDNDVGVIGVAPRTELYIFRAVSQYTGENEPEYIIRALRECIRQEVDIVSMSFGWLKSKNYDSFWGDLKDDFESLIKSLYYEHGILLVAACGNEKKDSEIAYPAGFPEVIAVGAINNNNPHTLWMDADSGSNYNASCYNYREGVELVAPGLNIYSTVPNDDYETMTGTSMAVPMVVGVGALVVEYQKKYDGNLTVQDIRTILEISARDLGPEGYDPMYGMGEVNAARAVDAAVLYHKDTDGDGVSDAMEKYYYYTDPFDTDTDNDNISDGDEIQRYFTDPLQPDSDNDGLTDYEEIKIYDTNPLDPDSDNDSIPDNWEINYSFNPNDPHDSASDPDNDGLRNIDEYYCGTNPLSNDTDNDQLPDGWEVWRNTNPLLIDNTADYDHDGLSNYEEYLDTTAPWSADTDGDGWTDYEEVKIYHTDPTDPSSVPYGGLVPGL
ncbi:MAG: S8 family serine peptidase [Candidatus Heimdallarchaeaceae archaeon]